MVAYTYAVKFRVAVIYCFLFFIFIVRNYFNDVFTLGILVTIIYIDVVYNRYF